MPEENKKENFTFSDKIKDSKTAASKSFANRVSSRIGRDGKPKLTIFERTKRDAPFLIAALVALLLLPFLYKYSGSVKEESIVTPSSSATAFDPERFAFAPDVENPEGEIAQLPGRDSLDLIKGWGSEEKYEASDDDLIDTDMEEAQYRDAFRQTEAASAKKSAKDTNVDIEENTTNIYKKRAVAGTRHSFKRAATKINPIGNGRKASPGGHNFGVTNWGGTLKKAAQKVGGPTAKDSPKPVSLQPLQAAGKPARVNFGDSAAAMRQAKDALGKHNAEKAILDAQVRPVDPGSFGGMTLGDTKFGGGSGKIDRQFNYTPQTPWWWDLMKTRSQMAWQKKFEWKWGIYDWMTKLAEKFLDKFLGCLLTGSEDWKMEHFLGTAAGSGSESECCGMKEKDWGPGLVRDYGKFGKAACDSFKKQGKTREGFKCDDGWVEGKPASRNLNFFQTRGACFGLDFGYDEKSQAAKIEMKTSCSELNSVHAYGFRPRGKAEDWDSYVYVVVRNYLPAVLDNSANGDMKLCSVYSDNVRGEESSAGIHSLNHYTAEELIDLYQIADQKDVARILKIDETINGLQNSDEIHRQGLQQYRNDSTASSNKAAAKGTEEAGKRAEKGKNQKLIDDLYKERNNIVTAYATSRWKTQSTGWAGAEMIKSEALHHACVIYVKHGSKGGVDLEWNQFRSQTIELLKSIARKNLGERDEGKILKIANKAFDQLDIMFVEGISSNKTIAHKSHTMENLPMMYWKFKQAFLERYGTTGKAGDTGGRAVYTKRKMRHEGKDTLLSDRCYYNNAVKISCTDNSVPPTATVTFNGESYHGGRAGMVTNTPLDPNKRDLNFTQEKKEIKVMASFVPSRPGIDVKPNFQIVNPAAGSTGNTMVYEFSLPNTFVDKESREELARGAEVLQQRAFEKNVPVWNGVPGRITWNLYRGGEVVSTAECDVDNAGNSVPSSPEVDNRRITPPSVTEPKPKELVPPAPQDPSRKMTLLAPCIQLVPGNVDGRKDYNNEERDCSSTTLFVGQKIPTQGQDQHCEETEPTMMDSQAALDFVNQVREAYAKQHPDRPLAEVMYKYPTDGEFIDALYLAQSLGITTVPAPAVCELARDFVRKSQDPHDRTVHNDLGAYLAYVHEESILYPTPKRQDAGNAFDMRFISNDPAVRKVNRAYGITPNTTVNVPLAGNFTQYNMNNDGQEGGLRNSYDARMNAFKATSTQTMNAHPLKGLVRPERTNALGVPCENCVWTPDKNRRLTPVERYNSFEGYKGLLRDEHYDRPTNIEEAQGQACVEFAGSLPNLKVDDVLKYVTGACEDGLDSRPYGAPKRIGPTKPQGRGSKNSKGGSKILNDPETHARLLQEG